MCAREKIKHEPESQEEPLFREFHPDGQNKAGKGLGKKD
jgi:hypothetical protein